MSYAFTPYANLLALDWLLTTGSVTRPAAWYVAIHTADPGDDGTANEVLVAADPAYVRQAVTFSAPDFSSATKKTTTNNTTSVTFTPDTGVSYSVVGISIWDAATSGNCLAQGIFLDQPKSISDVAPLTINSGKLPITLSGPFSEYSSELILNYLFTTGTATRPTTWFAGLHTGDPGDDGTANEVDKVAEDTAYVRKAMTFGAAATVSGIQRIAISGSATWTPVLVAGDYIVSHRSYWDSDNDPTPVGNCLLKGALIEPVSTLAGSLSLAANDDIIAMKL